MALDDKEVQRQLEHMVRFIEQEAEEKVEEIDVKALEEFNSEKGRQVQAEKVKLMHQYERKNKMVETQKKIAYSNELNTARLRLLKAQDEHFQHILKEAETGLDAIAKDKGKYKPLLEDLLVQGLLALLEDKVFLRVRKADLAMIKSVKSGALSKYKEKSKKDCALVIVEDDFLPDSCGGGVEMSACNGQIKVVNTLDRRLAAAAERLMPWLRHHLYGPSEDRTFFN